MPLLPVKTFVSLTDDRVGTAAPGLSGRAKLRSSNKVRRHRTLL